MISLIVSGVVVAVVAIFFIFGRQNLVAKNNEYEAHKQRLEEQIEQQQQVQQDLQERAKYVQTKKYIEEIAKSKLGLVYPDEIIFKPVVE